MSSALNEGNPAVGEEPIRPAVESQPPDRVAVVSVHGVADQQPGDTASSCVDALLRLRRDGRETYEASAETRLRIGVEPLAPAYRPNGKEAGRFSLLSPAVQAELKDPDAAESPDSAAEPEIGAAGAASEPEPLDHRDFREKLRDLEIPLPQRVWETVRFETRRIAGSGQAESGARGCEVHVHELYWADLSRLGNRWYGVLLSFYQLLFFLPVLGARTLGYARGELASRPGYSDGGWRAYGLLNAVAVRALAMAIPALNLALLGLATVLLVELVGGFDEPGRLVWILLGVPLAFLAVFLYWLQHQIDSSWGSRLALVVLFVAAFAGVYGALRGAPADAAAWTATVLWLGAMVVASLLMWSFARRLPGAFAVSVALFAVVTIRYLTAIWGRELVSWSDLFAAAADTAMETIRVGHVWIWFVFAVAVLLSVVAGRFASLRCVGASDRRQARRAAWTTNLALAMPGAVVLIVNLALWAGLIKLLVGVAGPQESPRAGDPPPLLDESRVSDLHGLLGAAIPPYFGWFLAVLLAALVVTLWAVAPAVLSDRRSLRRGGGAAAWHGKNLTGGFGTLKVAGWMVVAVVAVGFTASFALELRPAFEARVLSRFPDPFEATYSKVILVLGAGLIAVLMGRGPLAFLALGFRAALDVALDVINWLRHDPPRRAPGGLIASRYAALLEHLSEWRHPVDGGGYRAVVLVAHSQGTVITADLLRFLRREYAAHPPAGLRRYFLVDGHPDRLPVYLITMGCPLHQLYGLRFPFRYAWARDREGVDAWPTRSSDPADFHVARWVNAYRSADYVGRFLWHRDVDAREEAPWVSQPVRISGAREEVCIGPGGHNTYWEPRDRAARKGPEPVADRLDLLIEDACARPTGTP